MDATDFLVDVGNPAALDATLTALPGVVAQVVGGPNGPFHREDGHYVVRVFGGDTANTMFEFMVGTQGYCTVIGKGDGLV
jgi:arylamine N-acetyltransferase